MAVPNIFASQSGSIPLAQLDANFATNITLGSTTLQLGNTVTTLSGVTYAAPIITGNALPSVNNAQNLGSPSFVWNNVYATTFTGALVGTVTNGVYTVGNQTIDDVKTFSSTIVGSISGNAGTVTNGVYTTGDQTIGGNKTFSNSITGPIGIAVQNAGSFTTVNSSGLTTASSLTVTGTGTFSGAATFTNTVGFTGVATFTGTPTGAGLTARFSTPGPVGNALADTGAFTTCTATTFSGSGASLTNLPAGNLTGDVAQARLATALNASGAAPIYAARAWVSFNGAANTNLSGTYSQSGTTVTVTATAHGLIVGSSISVDITTGTGVDGIYTVATITDANIFTYTAGTSLTTSGNITILRNTIRASGNVSSITDNGAGDFTLNFTTALPDANYSVVGSASTATGNFVCVSEYTATTRTASVVRFTVRNAGNTASDVDFNNFVVFR